MLHPCRLFAEHQLRNIFVGVVVVTVFVVVTTRIVKAIKVEIVYNEKKLRLTPGFMIGWKHLQEEVTPQTNGSDRTNQKPFRLHFLAIRFCYSVYQRFWTSLILVCF